MSVVLSDTRLYGVANMPEADGVTCGGAVDFTKRLEFADIASTGLFDVVSSSASDVATKIIYAVRDSTGVINSETLTLAGQTKVPGTKSAERLLYAALSGASANGPLANPGGTAAVGDVALMAHTLTISAHTMQAGSANHTTTNPPVAKLQAGDGASVSPGMVLRTTGGTGPNQIRRILAVNPLGLGADFVAVDRDWAVIPDGTTTYEVATGFVFEILPNPVTAVIRAFSTCAADAAGGSQRIFYEEGCVVNNNTTLALTSAAIAIQAIAPSLPAGAALDIALASALNDTATFANRQTAPTGITSFTTGAPPQSINVPAPGNLPSGAAPNAAGAQKVVLRLTLPAGTTAYKGTATIRTTGNST